MAMTFKDYMNSTEWRLFCDGVVSERGGVCEACGSKDRVRVSIINYRSPGTYTGDDVVVKCYAHWSKKGGVPKSVERKPRPLAIGNMEKKMNAGAALDNWKRVQESSSASSLMRPILDMTGD